MLTHLAADGFRCLVDFELDLPRLALLAGANGAGKTSVVEVLGALQDLAWRGTTASEAFPLDSVTAWRRGTEQRFALTTVGLDGVDLRYEVRLDRTERGEAYVVEERVTGGDATLYEARKGEVRLYGDRPAAEPRTIIPFRRDRSFLAQLEPRPDNARLRAVRDALASIWIVRLNPFAMRGASRDEADWLARDGSNFASWYRSVQLDRPQAIEPLTRALAQVIHGFDGLAFSKGATTVRDLLVRFRSKSSGFSSGFSAGFGGTYELPFELLSEGQRALVVLYTLLAFVPDPGRTPFFVLDEPDNFVSLPEIQPWLRELSDRVAEKQLGALVISHHPEVVDYLAADEALWFARDPSGAAHARPLAVDRESGLRASEWIARGMAGDAPSKEP